MGPNTEPGNHCHTTDRQLIVAATDKTTGSWSLWHRKKALRFPQHRNPLEVEVNAEDNMENTTKLSSTSIQNTWTDTMRFHCLVAGEYSQIMAHIERCEVYVCR